jgi:hypothetical protein
MKAPSPVRRFAQAAAVGAALTLATLAPAADLDFSGGLSTEERAASGLSHLSPAETAVLDGLVAQDTTLAHEGGVTGFSSGFAQRHWDRERLASGLQQLSATERAALDRYAARAIALGPPPDQPFAWSPPKATPLLAAKPSPAGAVVTALTHMEVHGDVSFTVGAGSHGSSFYGTSMDFTATDPSGKFTVGVAFDSYRGKGLLGLCGPDGVYGPNGPYGPLYRGPGYLDW